MSAAWYGFDANDATACLQASLDSGAWLILVPAMDTPWIVQPLKVRSGTTLIFEEGVEIVSKKGSFQREDDALLALNKVEDVTLYGYGARLVMHKSDYRRPPYERSEWRHAIEMYGCARVTLLGLSAESSGGDGVYLGSGDRRFNEGIVLRDLALRDHYRQGISVISAVDLLIENVEISSTEGTLPSSGIDFEPNYAEESIVGCVLRDCVIHSNAGAGISILLHAFDDSSPDVDIRIENCFVSNNLFSLLVFGARKAHGRVEFVDTKLQGIQFIAPWTGVKITGN